MLDFLKSSFSKEVLGSKSVTLAFVALILATLIACAEFLLFSFNNGQAGSGGSSHLSESQYSMSYYYKETQDLTPAVSLHVLAEDGQNSRPDLAIEIFAALTFEDLSTSKEVKRISGEWFDLNGNLIRLFSLISELREHEKDDRIFRKKLSDATINRANFAAIMGEITFFR
jgi:hypothetical protein